MGIELIELDQAIVDSLYGFRKCLIKFLSFYEHVTCYDDNEDSVDVIFLDFAKALDEVSHQRLL
jgi:hypothetical protein